MLEMSYHVVYNLRSSVSSKISSSLLPLTNPKKIQVENKNIVNNNTDVFLENEAVSFKDCQETEITANHSSQSWHSLGSISAVFSSPVSSFLTAACNWA